MFAFIFIVSLLLFALSAVTLELGGQHLERGRSPKVYRGIGIAFIGLGMIGIFIAGGMP